MSGGEQQRAALDALRHAARWFEWGEDGVRPLLEVIGDASLVLFGEATHGTQEFYRLRADLTAALIKERHFNIVVAEADWRDAYRVNQWVRLARAEAGPEAALGDFVRFPRWMWRNGIVISFITWLRDYNWRRAQSDRVGLYGLDRYSLHTAIDAVQEFLAGIDPAVAERARQHYSRFEECGTDAQSSSDASGFRLSKSREDEVVTHLAALQGARAHSARSDGRMGEETFFFTGRNDQLVRNAEQYHRGMFGGHVEAWNLRETHMMETLDVLLDWTTQRAGYARGVVWAHNSHLGDARATRMGELGALNLGQLARERYGYKVCLLGCTTHTGTVMAARAWDRPPGRRQIQPSVEGSCERLFHDVGLERFVLPTAHLRSALGAPRLQRAIGAVYRPENERAHHYLRVRLADQFDAVIHFDSTTALEPLERRSLGGSDRRETHPVRV